MDNTINNSLVFGAKLTTTIGNKGGSMKKVSQKFSKMTEKFDGELFIDKAEKASQYEFSYNGVMFVTSALNKAFESINYKSSSKELNSLAEKLKYMIKAMSIESQYTQNTAASKQQLAQLKKLLARNEKARLMAKKEGLDKIVTIYDGVIEGYRANIDSLKEKIKFHQDKTLKKLDKIKNKCEGLDFYKDSLDRNFKFQLM